MRRVRGRPLTCLEVTYLSWGVCRQCRRRAFRPHPRIPHRRFLARATPSIVTWTFGKARGRINATPWTGGTRGRRIPDDRHDPRRQTGRAVPGRLFRPMPLPLLASTTSLVPTNPIARPLMVLIAFSSLVRLCCSVVCVRALLRHHLSSADECCSLIETPSSLQTGGRPQGIRR